MNRSRRGHAAGMRLDSSGRCGATQILPHRPWKDARRMTPAARSPAPNGTARKVRSRLRTIAEARGPRPPPPPRPIGRAACLTSLEHGSGCRRGSGHTAPGPVSRLIAKGKAPGDSHTGGLACCLQVRIRTMPAHTGRVCKPSGAVGRPLPRLARDGGVPPRPTAPDAASASLRVPCVCGHSASAQASSPPARRCARRPAPARPARTLPGRLSSKRTVSPGNGGLTGPGEALPASVTPRAQGRGRCAHRPQCASLRAVRAGRFAARSWPLRGRFLAAPPLWARRFAARPSLRLRPCCGRSTLDRRTLKTSYTRVK